MDLSTEQASRLDGLEVCKRLQTDPQAGLTWTEAKRRLESYGPNEFAVTEKDSLIQKYLEQFKNPLIVLLLCSAFVSICMQQFDDAFSITAAIVIVVTVAFVQEYRSEKSLEELNKLVPPTCKAIRAGKVDSFYAKFLVPGDIVLLTSGDRVPADVRILEAVGVSIDESSFTGETHASNKFSESHQQQSGGKNTDNVAFMGTLMCTGNARGVVIHTGVRSQFGEIFALMQQTEAPKTPLQKSMDTLGKQLSFYSFGIIGLIMVIGCLQGRPVMEMFNIGVSLAVAAIPEGLPIVVTVTLALGVMRMAKQNAVIKRLPTVETLGCATVICSDKTGTLTKNEMTVTTLISSNLSRANVTGVGYNPSGGKILLEQEDTFEEFLPILKAGIICNNATIGNNNRPVGQPTEAALLVAGKKANIKDLRTVYRRMEEIPFSSTDKVMIVRAVNEQDSKTSGWQSLPQYFVKGAVEKVLESCSTYMCNDKQLPVTEERKQQYFQEAVNLGKRGLRVLAFAYGEQRNSLCFVGLAGIEDPPKAGVAEAIKILRKSSVDVKMLTGDSKETAKAISNLLSLPATDNLTMSGDEIDALEPILVRDRIARTVIFYRVGPSHKLKIVQALQDSGYIVGMTGDGVNDGVALKKADIGIAMGKTGTDVCKEASDMILVNDDFYTIMLAIEEGKSIFYNIRNFVRFQLSTSIAALSLIAVATLWHIPNPLNAMQILWINIIMDGPPAQSLGLEPCDPDIVSLPPRNVKEPMINRQLISNVLISAAIIIAGTMFIFVNEMSDGQVTPRDTTMTFTCFVFFDMFNALSCRSQTKSIFTIGLTANKPFLLAVLFSLVGQMLVIYVPFFQRIFVTEALYISDLLLLLLITSSVFIVSEVRKLLANSRQNSTSGIVLSSNGNKSGLNGLSRNLNKLLMKPQPKNKHYMV